MISKFSYFFGTAIKKKETVHIFVFGHIKELLLIELCQTQYRRILTLVAETATVMKSSHKIPLVSETEI